MKKSLKKNLFFVFGISGLIATTFLTGVYYGKGGVYCEICPSEDLNFSLFWETYQNLREKYVDPEKIDTEKMLYGAISGMVDSLDDPYTVFMSPDSAKKFREDISGSFEGVGMEIGRKDGNLQVIAPLEGTPAQKAGLRAGDRILQIDDTLTAELTLDEVVSMIRGPKGTEVVLSIFRSSWDAPEDIAVKRGFIKIPSLRWEQINFKGESDAEGKVAYIKLYHFTEKAGVDFAGASFKVLASSADRIVLDLRNNPGGYLEIARDIAGFFLEKGALVTIEDSGDEQKNFEARGTFSFKGYPVVVLINQGSASGSEILAGALRDNRDIMLIGETSFGKGSVQQLEELSGGSSLKVTIAKWLTPNGETIHEKGLEPDIKVEMKDEDYKEGRDPQLNKALEIIQGL